MRRTWLGQTPERFRRGVRWFSWCDAIVCRVWRVSSSCEFDDDDARIGAVAIAIGAAEKGVDFAAGDTGLLTSEPELTLIRSMAKMPEIIETVALSHQPHHLPFYAQDLATVFHSFYKQCRVISEDVDMTAARLKLVLAARIVLARTLSLMGMSAPDRM